MVSPIADFVVDIGPDGRILSQGSLSNALAHDAQLVQDMQHEQEDIEKAEQELDHAASEDDKAQQSGGKLIVEEETEIGHIGSQACKSEIVLYRALKVPLDYIHPVLLFARNMSERPSLFWGAYVGLYVVRYILNNLEVSSFQC